LLFNPRARTLHALSWDLPGLATGIAVAIAVISALKLMRRYFPASPPTRGSRPLRTKTSEVQRKPSTLRWLWLCECRWSAAG